ncbi:MAG: flagellar hook-length control protein FliK [Candidatus Desulforudis sp.]|nr:flagellar hook-length control protein FliK [Bacillota bacterium]MBU4553682.1 flagellar hook-length control protein FliK [Bacillota bacterium]MBV1727730.1 flagellar hook-length control protein FliK [Desulforudis sp.]MBV1769997.1 flagellar hook-length control protein FliK [Desulforudis sp.]
MNVDLFRMLVPTPGTPAGKPGSGMPGSVFADLLLVMQQSSTESLETVPAYIEERLNLFACPGQPLEFGEVLPQLEAAQTTEAAPITVPNSDWFSAGVPEEQTGVPVFPVPEQPERPLAAPTPLAPSEVAPQGVIPSATPLTPSETAPVVQAGQIIPSVSVEPRPSPGLGTAEHQVVLRAEALYPSDLSRTVPVRVDVSLMPESAAAQVNTREVILPVVPQPVRDSQTGKSGTRTLSETVINAPSAPASNQSKPAPALHPFQPIPGKEQLPPEPVRLSVPVEPNQSQPVKPAPEIRLYVAGKTAEPILAPDQIVPTTTANKGGTVTAPPVIAKTFQESITRQVVDRVLVALEGMRGQVGKVSRLELALNPPQLGKVVIRLVWQNAGLQVRFYTVDQAVRSTLEQALPQLREALAKQDVNIFEMSANLARGDGNGQTPTGRWLSRFIREGDSGPETENQTPDRKTDTDSLFDRLA